MQLTPLICLALLPFVAETARAPGAQQPHPPGKPAGAPQHPPGKPGAAPQAPGKPGQGPGAPGAPGKPGALPPVLGGARNGDSKVFRQEPGKFPTIYDALRDVRAADAPLHEDTSGGCAQELRALEAAPGAGYAAVWSDMRNGNLGLYLGLLDADAKVVGEDRPVNPPLTSRQFEPALALTQELRGAVAWYSTSFGRNGVSLRFFDGAKGFLGLPIPVSDKVPAAAGGAAAGRGAPGGREAPGAGREAPGGAPAGPGAGRAAPAEGRAAPADGRAAPSEGRAPAAGRGAQPSAGLDQLPVVRVGPTGAGLVAWAQNDKIYVQRFASPSQSEGEPVALEAPGARGRLHLQLVGEKNALLAYSTAESIHCRQLGAQGAGAEVEVGPGRLEKLAHDPRGGWWLLVEHADRFFLRHVDGQGKQDREDLLPLNEALVSADFACIGEGLALAFTAERSAPAAGAPPCELWVLMVDGKKLYPEPFRFPRDGAAWHARGPRVAAQKSELLIAWTDERRGDADVWYERVPLAAQADAKLEELRWNSDGPSSAQLPGSIASNGSRAVAVWQDERSGTAQVYLRALDERGPAGPELAVAPIAASAAPAAGRSSSAERASGAASAAAAAQLTPTVAVAEDGSALVAWWSPVEGRAQLRAAILAADGHSLAAPFELDAGAAGEAQFQASACALPRGAGFGLLWIRKNGGPVVARIGAHGELLSGPSGLGVNRGGLSRNPYLCALDDGRALALWDIKGDRDAGSLRAQFLSPNLAPAGEEFAFDSSPGGGDQDPCAVATPGGGFLMAWTGNEGPERDVFARAFGPDGKAVSQPLAISVKANEQDFAALCTLADGSYLCAWEDDISGRDHCVVRRIGADLETLGPRLTLNERATSYVEDRTFPRIAPLGAGFAAIWGDRRRSLGQDTYFKIAGPAFDAPAAEPVR